MTASTRAGAFLVRAWWEHDAFRARVTYRLDVARTEQREVVTANAEEVHRLLDVWLHEAVAVREGDLG